VMAMAMAATASTMAVHRAVAVMTAVARAAQDPQGRARQPSETPRARCGALRLAMHRRSER
jgi:hypothetical protein